MANPIKPFPSYKWRWLSVQPTEGLLKAPVFLGVLRVLGNHQGERYSSDALYGELERVQEDTRSSVTLARKSDRNLFRNSGQYWRGTGLLSSARGEIQLTALGRQVAEGGITRDQFVALMVRNTVLPNPRTYNTAELRKWRDAGLRVKPFEIILAVMAWLGKDLGTAESFLTPQELISIIIPMAGEKARVQNIARTIQDYRSGNLDVSSWPDCAPAANDKRLAREFLLFLENFGICQTDSIADGYKQRFSLSQVLGDEIQPNDHRSFLENVSLVDEEIAIASGSEIPEIIERQRIFTSSIGRPTQKRFRREVLAAANESCILTSETTTDVLEAAHIIPVEHGGVESVGNGFCMRADIHRLFDNGKIRIHSSGDVLLDGSLASTVSYSGLPSNITFPSEIAVSNILWRERYL